ncbi:MAG TPA: hypothetical protein PLA06_06060, partial [Syntrophorhabdaceae bacterium]|nr:hypothetical protein [Syntrophorhabdaceae bacterium]
MKSPCANNILVLVFFTFLMLSFVAPALAVSTHGPITHGPITHGPITHGPITHGPITHGPISGGKCNPGYGLTSYR